MGDPRRTQSDIDIHDRDHILTTHRKSNSNQIASDGGEFYTAIGTDGMECQTIKIVLISLIFN